MSFAEEFYQLDPGRLERAYANTSERLLSISESGDAILHTFRDYFDELKQASPEYPVLLGKQEEAIDMLSGVPGMEYSHDRYQMIRMLTGMLAAGMVLAEYARLEQEES